MKFLNNQLYPSLDLVGSYGFNGAGRQFGDTFDQFDSADRRFYSYGAQLSMPLSNVGPRNQVKSGKVTLQQLLLQLKQLEQTVMVQIDNAVKQAQSSYQSVQATQQARTYAEAAARSQEIRALADYNQALANLAAEEGSTLERHHITIEMK